MSRQKKPARLYLRPDTQDWIIRDGSTSKRTGVSGECNREAAERELARYIAGKDARRTGPAQPHEITVGEVLAAYIENKGSQMKDTERLIYAAKALAPYWGDLTCDAVKGATCRAYTKFRAAPRVINGRSVSASPATVRRELVVLQAAFNDGVREGLLIYAPQVTLPAHGKPRDRALTRSEAARLLWGLRKGRNPQVARVVLIILYTGTRPGAAMKLRMVPSLTGGWIDVERGILHRKGSLEDETKKRRGSCRMPRRLLAHARRWVGQEWVCMWRGGPVKDIGKAIDGACDRARIERIVPHELKHTAITWAFQNGMKMEDATSFFSTSADTLERVYRAESPEYQERAASIMEKRK